MVWELLVIVLLIVVNGFFAMSELAVVSARRARLQQLAENGRRAKGAKAALELAENPSHFLSTVQIGITLIGIVAGAYGGATLAERFGGRLDQIPWIAPYGQQVAFALVVAGITYLSLIVGELAPKRLALVNAEGIAVAVARPMQGLSRVALPLAWLLGASTEALLKLLRLPTTREQTVTEEEVKTLIAEGTQSGVFDPAERQMIEGVLRLADRTVRAIMTPRPDVLWLDPEDKPEAIATEIRDSGYSRFPVCRGDVDEVLGIVSAKALLDQALRGRAMDLRGALVQPLIVHDGTPVLRLLELFKQSTVHMAVVVDEYGSVEGIVTLTDILESIAGELPEAGQDADAGMIRREDGSWLVDGMLPVDEVEARIGVPDLKGEGGYHTLAGFVLERLGHVPTAAEHFVWRGHRFEVVDMDGRRIDKVMIQRVDLPPEEP
ncbi:hemolysin family protein [Azospirillum sp.]|uniref:hemolysin family protein n=1 Tax=Azospirillum sp. TaxID=34012 RepID=UPI003D7592AE